MAEFTIWLYVKDKISRELYCSIKYHHDTISVSILGIFLKLHTYIFTAYLRRELGGDQPIKNGTLHGKHNNNNNNNTAISRLHFEAFS